jgi:DNA-binding transcriptional regulator YiaG
LRNEEGKERKKESLNSPRRVRPLAKRPRGARSNTELGRKNRSVTLDYHIRDSRISCSKTPEANLPFMQTIDVTTVATKCIRDSRIERLLQLLIMQNSSWRRDDRRRQKDRRKRSRPTKLREHLRAWRQKHDLSQSEAGLKLQISRRTLQEWEQGRAIPRGLARVSLRQVTGR